MRKFSLLLLTLASILPSQAAPESFAYVLQADAIAKEKPVAIKRLSTISRDWIVLDAAFSEDQPWTAEDITAIRGAKPNRKVIAYISIGEAEDYRPYWQESWSKTKPKWLGPENPAWKGNYRVDFWNPEWQAIMLASIDSAMAAGFDGVYLDIVDAFENFEKDGARFIDDRPNPATKQSYRRDMVDWVKKIAARARTKKADALVIPQNGSQLLEHPDFVSTISGIGIEDLFTEDNRLQPKSHTEYVLGFLKTLGETNKPVLVIEYPNKKEPMNDARRLNHEQGFTWLITDRELRTPGISGR